MKKLFILLTLLLISSLFCEEMVITKDEILDKYVKAIGGTENIDRVNTKTCSGYLIKNVHWETPAFDVIEFNTNSHNTKDFSISYTENEKEHPNLLNYNDHLIFLFIPHNSQFLRFLFDQLTFIGIKTIKNRKVYALVMESTSPEYKTVYIDVDTNLITSIGNYVELKDYRTVDNVLIPHRMIFSRKGGNYTYFVKNAEHN